MKKINSTKEILSTKQWKNVTSTKTKNNYQGQIIFKVTKKYKYLHKGDYFYLDNKHRDHIEVYSKNRKSRLVLNLDMTINKKKTKASKHRTLKLK